MGQSLATRIACPAVGKCLGSTARAPRHPLLQTLSKFLAWCLLCLLRFVSDRGNQSHGSSPDSG